MANVNWVWTAGVLSDSAQVTVAVGGSVSSVRVRYSSSSSFASETWTAAIAPSSGGYCKLSLDGLTPGTRYYYQAELDGVLDATFTGEFSTWTAGDQDAFAFAFASCNDTGSTNLVFSCMAADRLAFIHLGDKGYPNVSTNSKPSFVANYEANFAAAVQKEWHRVCPVEYVWDDHDFGADNSDGSSASKPAAEAAFREIVPSYELGNPVSGDIRRAWTVNGVRFILTDLRYNRDANSSTSASKSILGAAQRAWFLGQIDQAQTDGCRLIIWCNTQVWNGGSGPIDSDGDHWGSFEYERRLIMAHLRANPHPPVVVIAGDAHMLSAKHHVEKSTSLLLLQSAALDYGGNVRGNGWDAGPWANRTGDGQYSIVRVSSGSNPMVTWEPRRVDSDGAVRALGEGVYRFAPGAKWQPIRNHAGFVIENVRAMEQ